MDLIKGVLVALAVLGFCLPEPVSASGVVVDQGPVAIDVVLKDGGVLIGQVVDPQGSALPKATVLLRAQGREIATTKTDTYGHFAVRGLRGGLYQLLAAGGHGTYRLWTPGTAPPSSQQGALVVAGGRTVRGQVYGSGYGPLKCWLANPWVVAGIVATAVAVPVGIHNSKRPASP